MATDGPDHEPTTPVAVSNGSAVVPPLPPCVAVIRRLTSAARKAATSTTACPHAGPAAHLADPTMGGRVARLATSSREAAAQAQQREESLCEPGRRGRAPSPRAGRNGRPRLGLDGRSHDGLRQWILTYPVAQPSRGRRHCSQNSRRHGHSSSSQTPLTSSVGSSRPPPHYCRPRIHTYPMAKRAWGSSIATGQVVGRSLGGHGSELRRDRQEALVSGEPRPRVEAPDRVRRRRPTLAAPRSVPSRSSVGCGIVVILPAGPGATPQAIATGTGPSLLAREIAPMRTVARSRLCRRAPSGGGAGTQVTGRPALRAIVGPLPFCTAAGFQDDLGWTARPRWGRRSGSVTTCWISDEHVLSEPLEFDAGEFAGGEIARFVLRSRVSSTRFRGGWFDLSSLRLHGPASSGSTRLRSLGLTSPTTIATGFSQRFDRRWRQFDGRRCESTGSVDSQLFPVGRVRHGSSDRTGRS